MLIKESTLRRIIREEAHRVLREEVAGSLTSQWKGISDEVLTFANNIQSNLPSGGSGDKVYAALKELTDKGNASSYARKVFVPATPANPPAAAGGSAVAVAQLACLLSGLVTGEQQNDYNSASMVLTGKSTMQDILSKPMLAALTTFSRAAAIISDIRKLADSQNPSYVAPSPKPMATDPGAGTFLSVDANGNVPVNVSVGNMTYELHAGAVYEMAKTMSPIARGQKVLKLGAQGPDVMTLQQLLRNIATQTSAFAAPTLTGKYDAPTAAAVKAYQKAAGIVADGAVGQQTLAQFIGKNSSMTGQAGDKGNFHKGAQSAAGTQPMGGAGINPNLAIAQRPTQK